MKPDGLSRRGLLGGIGVVGLGAVGWTGLTLADPINGSDPEIPEDDLEEDGWVEMKDEETETEEAAGPLTVTIQTNTLTYKHQQLNEQLRSRRVRTSDGPDREISHYKSGAFSDPIRVFSAARTDLNPNFDNLPGGIGRAEIMGIVEEQAKSEFEAEMEDAGLTDIEESDQDTIEVDTGEDAVLFEFTAVYPFDGIDVDVRDRTVSLPSADIEVVGHMAMWHHGDSILVAGGAHPNENYEESRTEEGEFGRDLTVSVDLGLEPDDYEEETLALVEEVE